MRTVLALGAVLMVLGATGCGGGDDTTSTPAAGASGTSGPQGSGSGGGMTAKEFLDASIPDEVAAVQDAADANPDCSATNTDAGSDFQVQVAIDSASADPNTAIAEIVANNC
jgi:hypothetical protein